MIRELTRSSRPRNVSGFRFAISVLTSLIAGAVVYGNGGKRKRLRGKGMCFIMSRSKLIRILALFGIVLTMFALDIFRQRGIVINPEYVLNILSIGFIAWVASVFYSR